jgi:ribosomal protein S18 acetylase RimI-like enzyme
MMTLTRVRARETARAIAAGVRKYNHISCRTRDVLSNPHFSIGVDGQLAGWLGYRRSRRKKHVYEIVHMGIKPEFRRQGLAKAAVLQVLDMIFAIGGERAFVRINYLNEPSMGLAKDMGFRLVTRVGKVNYFSRPLDGNAVEEAAQEEGVAVAASEEDEKTEATGE